MLAFLFPGQGSQKPEMLHHLPDHPAISDVLDEASEILNESVFKYHSNEALTSTAAVQISLLVAGVAVYKAFESDGISPHFVAGHSVGAFGAAVAAKVMSFSQALKLVKRRGELMEQVYPSGYGMGVTLGIKEPQLKEIVEAFSTENHPVYIANLNAPDQMTISGSLQAIKRVIEHVRENGARKAEILNVSTPSHCELLKSVSVALALELSEIDLRRPSIPFSANRTARLLINPDDIRRDLAESVSASVRWHEVSSVLYEKGTRLFIEMPPGKVLTNLVAQAFPNSRALSVAESGYDNCKFLADRIL